MLSVSCLVKFLQTIESAHKKGAGSTKNHSHSVGERLGVKIYVVDQFHPGKNVGLGRYHTIFALINGLVDFEKFGPAKKKVSVNMREVQAEHPK